MVARGAREREIVFAWLERGFDPFLLQSLLVTVGLGDWLREEEALKPRLRRELKKARGHLEKVRAGLMRVDGLDSGAGSVGRRVPEWVWEQIKELDASITALRGEPRRRRRPDKRHVSRFMLVVSEQLRELTGRPHWGEIAEFVTGLGLAKQLTARHAQIRALQYRGIDPGAFEKPRKNARRRVGFKTPLA